MNKRKLLIRLMNNQKNVKFNDFVTIIKAFDFKFDRTDGSHQIYKNADINERMNIQSKNGEAKPYQINQFLRLIEKYDLELDDNGEE